MALKQVVLNEMVASYDEALEFIDESLEELPSDYEIFGVHIRMIDDVNWRVTVTFDAPPEPEEEDEPA